MPGCSKPSFWHSPPRSASGDNSPCATDSPTAEWTSLQLIQAFPFDTVPRYVIRDRDSIYGEKVGESIRALGIEEKVISYQSPWQKGYTSHCTSSVAYDRSSRWRRVCSAIPLRLSRTGASAPGSS